MWGRWHTTTAVLQGQGSGDNNAMMAHDCGMHLVHLPSSPLPPGNALVYECVKAVAAIHPSPVLIAGAMESVTRFLASRCGVTSSKHHRLACCWCMPCWLRTAARRWQPHTGGANCVPTAVPPAPS